MLYRLTLIITRNLRRSLGPLASRVLRHEALQIDSRPPSFFCYHSKARGTAVVGAVAAVVGAVLAAVATVAVAVEFSEHS